MPTLGEMPPISRPFQILLIVFALFVGAYGAWFLVLRGPTSTTSSSSSASTPAAPTPAPRVHQRGPAQPGKVYHGSAPGVEGLTRAVVKAHGAVEKAQRSGEHELSKVGANEHGRGASTHPSGTPKTSSPQAQSTAKTGTHTATKPTTASTPTTKATSPTTKTASPSPQTKSQGSRAPGGTSQAPVNQAIVESVLKAGKTALVLFWDGKAADDQIAHQAVLSLARSQKSIAAFFAKADQVASFGSITRSVQVYGTPTLLVVDPKGQATTITGATDELAIEQLIDQLRHP